MVKVSSKTILHTPVDTVWQVIRDFDAACQYMVMVVRCTVEGAGVGALRTLTSADGSTIVERLDKQDEAARRVSYTLLSDTPFRNCLTSLSVDDLGGGWCELAWSATFEADGIPAGEAQDMFASALAANSLALKQFLEQRS